MANLNNLNLTTSTASGIQIKRDHDFSNLTLQCDAVAIYPNRTDLPIVPPNPGYAGPLNDRFKTREAGKIAVEVNICDLEVAELIVHGDGDFTKDVIINGKLTANTVAEGGSLVYKQVEGFLPSAAIGGGAGPYTLVDINGDVITLPFNTEVFKVRYLSPSVASPIVSVGTFDIGFGALNSTLTTTLVGTGTVLTANGTTGGVVTGVASGNSTWGGTGDQAVSTLVENVPAVPNNHLNIVLASAVTSGQLAVNVTYVERS